MTGARANDRGAGWVWSQSLLMTAQIAAGPVWPANWHSPIGLTVGAVLFVVAGIIGITGVIQLGRNRTPFPRPRPDSRLIQSGVYGWCRHPLYLSVMMASVGWALLFQSAPSLLLAAALPPFFNAKARREEQWLREAFPDYQAYERRVGRFFPRHS